MQRVDIPERKNTESDQINSLYPERALDNTEKFIEEIKSLESGVGLLDLNKEEHGELLQWEGQLGEVLEEIYKIKIKRQIFYPEYFLTTAGRQTFQEKVSLKIQGDTVEEVEGFFYENRAIMQNMFAQDRVSLGRKSVNHSNMQLYTNLKETIDDNGDISTDNISVSRRFDLLINPEDLLDKVQKLRTFKQKLKIEKQNISKGLEQNDLVEAKKIILELYRRKTNELIVKNFGSVVSIYKVAEHCDLTGVEREVVMTMFKFADITKAYARYDKFIHGASNEYDETGSRKQISEKLRKYTIQIEKELITSELTKKAKIKEKGLSIAKICKKNIPATKFMELVGELLDKYGQKSSQVDYDPDSAESAKDGLWRSIADPDVKSMTIKSLPRVVLLGAKDKSAYGIIAVLLGHEIEGHVVQSINSAQINLRLFDVVKGDRLSVFAEMGAMYVQNKVSKEAFGFETIPKPFYVQAMVTKLEGGNYLDCIKTYYDGWKRLIFKKREAGLISAEKAGEQFNAKLKVAIKSTKRLFRPGVDLNIASSNLLKSKDTAYLE